MDTVAEAFKQTGWLGRFFLKYYMKNVNNSLDDDEKLIGMGSTIFNSTDFIFITNKRVLGYKVKDKSHIITSIPLNNITSFDLKTHLGTTNIEVKSQSEHIFVPSVSMKTANELQKIILNLAN